MSDPAARPRTVLDCNSLVQAVAFSDSPAAACLALAEAGAIELFVTRSTLQELRRVLTYDEILAISPNMTPVRIAAFLQRLAFRATLIRRVRHAIDYPRDPADEPYLDLAVTIDANFLASRDKDLLALAGAHSAVAKRLRRMARGLRIVTPEKFLEAVGQPWATQRGRT